MPRGGRKAQATTPAELADLVASPPDARKWLDDFLVDNQELEALDARLKRFNILGVLGVSRAELRHSNLLAWLLDPAGSHGLGDRFLRRFLSRLIRDKQDLSVDLRPAEIELMSLADVEVLREWHHIDVLVRSRTGRWTLLIENKVGSSEKPGQLARYVREAQTEWPDQELIPVFLTLDGEDPSDDGRESGFVGLGWGEVCELLTRLVKQFEAQIPHDAKLLLDHYLDTLRKLTMQDAELIQLCKTIYRKHKAAIDLIVEYGSSSQILDSCEQAIRTLSKDMVTPLRTGGRVWFLPKEMDLRGLPQCAWGPSGNTAPVLWWFAWLKSGKLQLSMEVGPIEDKDLRIRLITLAQKTGFRSKKAFKPDARFTRLYTETKALSRNEDGEWRDDDEHIQATAATMWKSAWSKGKNIVDVLQKVAQR